MKINLIKKTAAAAAVALAALTLTACGGDNEDRNEARAAADYEDYASDDDADLADEADYDYPEYTDEDLAAIDAMIEAMAPFLTDDELDELIDAIELLYVMLGGDLTLLEEYLAEMFELGMVVAEMEMNAAIVRELIVGYWMWEFDNEWVYVFEADGTGVRGSEETGHQLFTWEVVDDEFRINTGGMTERWAVLVTENTAIFESLQTDEVWSYIRLGNIGDFDWILQYL